jgi:dTDP-4-amino-4,6-dideoxygalactose transaminase
VRTTRGWREAPPTAGLPLLWHDFFARGALFEPALAAFLATDHVQIEASGSAAWLVALTALKALSRRRSVVVPAYTCPLVVLAISQCGLRAVPCETRAGHFDFCPDALAAACNEDTLAVVPTHLAGRVANLDLATGIARKAGAYAVEDCAQSLGARWNDRAAGTLGDIGFYSFGVGKGLSLGGGGALSAQDPTMREALLAASRSLGRSSRFVEARKLAGLAGYRALYRPWALGLVFGMPLRRHLKKGRIIEAAGDHYAGPIGTYRVGAWRRAIGASALGRLPAFIAETTAQAQRRVARLSAIPRVSVIGDLPGAAGVWPVLLTVMPTPQSRDRALSTLWSSGLGVGRMFIHALPDYPMFDGQFDPARTPQARDFAARALTITNSPWLREEDFLWICSVIERSLD